jgi:hypothetical protein
MGQLASVRVSEVGERNLNTCSINGQHVSTLTVKLRKGAGDGSMPAVVLEATDT